MAEFPINIRITLTDKITAELKKASNGMKDFAQQMRQTGRQMSYVGMSMSAVGASIVAPLTLAYKTAGKFNAEIAHQLNETKNVFDNLSLSIGKSLLPVMRQLTDSVANAVAWWKKLDDATRDKIIQSIWNFGKALIFTGTALVIIGKSLSTLANITLIIANFSKLAPFIMGIVSPLGLASLGFLALGIAMIKWKPIADGVIRTFALLTKLLTGGLLDIKAEPMIANFDKMREDLQGFADFWKEITGSLTAGGKKEEDSGGGFWSGFQLATEEAMTSLKNFQQLGYDVANSLRTSLSSAFSSFINDAFSGQLKRAKDYFADFGKSILNIFAQTIAEMASKWIAFQALMAGRKLVGSIIGLLGSMSGATNPNAGQGTNTGVYGSDNFTDVNTNTVATPYYHFGGIVRAHSGLAVDEVPIVAQRGERILSRSQNREYEKGMDNKSVNYYIYAVDAQSFAQMLYRNKQSVHAIFSAGMKNNTSMRGAIKSYG